MKKEKSCGTIIIENNKVILIKQNKGHWTFAKGHVENNETEEETALRETKEETNIDVKINSQYRYSINYIINNKIDKEVIFFLATPLTYNIKNQESEVKEVKWVSFEKALELLTYKNTKDLFLKLLEDLKKDNFH